MQFNSYIFILGFLPVLVIAYFLAQKINYTAGKIVIILGSLIFYGYGDKSALLVICLSLVINYLFGYAGLRWTAKKAADGSQGQSLAGENEPGGRGSWFRKGSLGKNSAGENEPGGRGSWFRKGSLGKNSAGENEPGGQGSQVENDSQIEPQKAADCMPKAFMAVPVIINVSLLLYFKYTNFAISSVNRVLGSGFEFKEIIAPIGISFFTFQQIAYIVAIYKKEIERLNVIDYVSYILYFPKLLMGPLMDPVDFLKQYNDPELKKVNFDNIACGIKIFSFGLLKKVLLADTFAGGVSFGFENFDKATSFDWILIMLFYTFEIYFDFSGYSDMAVGVSKMLNITLPINFDSPYKAVSIRDFWKRWHISLTKFLTKYVYIPLGGSRKGLLFTCINTMIVFLVSGIWHGANWSFIIWGLLHGAFSVFDRLIEKKDKKIFEPARWLMTFVVVNVLWLLFRAESVGQWVKIMKTILVFKDTTISEGLIAHFTLPEANVIFRNLPVINKINEMTRGFIMNGFILVSAAICFLFDNNYRNYKKLTIAGMILAAVCFVFGLTCLTQESVFVYFNF